MGEQREGLQSVGIERVVTVEPIGDINGDDLPELLWVQGHRENLWVSHCGSGRLPSL
ncbi:MAG: hypothetical protein IT374_25240 [Polyangiaceae bacterium]|nr:hypothetical protein [Polyangiaceae bacterium]